LLRVLPARYVPSSGFPDPLDGFRPSMPCRLCFTPAALLGFSLRSFLLPQGTRCVSAREDPHTVSASVIPTAEAVGRPGSPRFLGFCPYESPLRLATCLACQSPDAPLGFSLLGFSSKDLRQAFAQRPLTRFAMETSPTAGASESRSVFARLSHAATVNRERRKQPFQGSCTWQILVIRASFRPGYVFASRLAEHHCPRLAILGRTPEPCLS
jgi:hypothetical protein